MILIAVLWGVWMFLWVTALGSGPCFEAEEVVA